MTRPLRAPRADNRMPHLLDEAARLFGAQGFHGTSIRDIVRAVDMLPGSIYYHFATKDLLLARRLRRGRAPDLRACRGRRGGRETDPWERLEAACVAHLEAVLEESGYAQVVIRVRPVDVPSATAQLNELRDDVRAAVRRARRRAAGCRTASTGAACASCCWVRSTGRRPGTGRGATVRARSRSTSSSCCASRSSPNRFSMTSWTSARKCSSPRSASTATTAAAASSPPICATPAWK